MKLVITNPIDASSIVVVAIANNGESFDIELIGDEVYKDVDIGFGVFQHPASYHFESDDLAMALEENNGVLDDETIDSLGSERIARELAESMDGLFLLIGDEMRQVTDDEFIKAVVNDHHMINVIEYEEGSVDFDEDKD